MARVEVSLQQLELQVHCWAQNTLGRWGYKEILQGSIKHSGVNGQKHMFPVAIHKTVCSFQLNSWKNKCFPLLSVKPFLQWPL